MRGPLPAALAGVTPEVPLSSSEQAVRVITDAATVSATARPLSFMTFSLVVGEPSRSSVRATDAKSVTPDSGGVKGGVIGNPLGGNRCGSDHHRFSEIDHSLVSSRKWDDA